MFIGHYGIAFGLKKLDKVVSLGWLFVAVQMVDIFWTLLVFFGVEKVAIVPGLTAANPLDFIYYPFTHSVVAFIIWGLVAFIIVYLGHFRSSLTKAKFGLLIGFAVISHLLLDLIVHRPDIPLASEDSIKFGFGLWNHVAVSYTLEALIFVGGALIYYKAVDYLTRKRKIALGAFVIVLLLINLINLIGPPPPDTTTIAVTGFISYIVFALFGFWLDRVAKNEL